MLARVMTNSKNSVQAYCQALHTLSLSLSYTYQEAVITTSADAFRVRQVSGPSHVIVTNAGRAGMSLHSPFGLG